MKNLLKKSICVLLSFMFLVAALVFPTDAAGIDENTGEGIPSIDYQSEEKVERPYDMHTDLQYGYLNDPEINSIFNYAKGDLELSYPKAIVCDFSEDEGIGEAESYIIQKSAAPDFSDPITIGGLTKKEYGFYNLLLGEHFYWRGGTDLETISYSPIHEVTVSSQGPRNCYVDGITNIRDIGGYASSLVPSGYIRQGLYYRGAKPDNVTEIGKKTMTETLGVLAEIDLRDFSQCKGPYIDGVSYTAVPIPSGTESVRFEAFPREYRQIYAVIAEAGENPVYLHCTAGADRTGIVTFMLLAVCGVDLDDIARDYLFTNFSTQGPRYKENEFDKWVTKLGNLEGDTLAEQAKSWMLSKGIPESQIEQIRETFVEGYVAQEVSQPETEANTEEPVTEEATADEPTASEPATDAPTTDAPTTDEPKKKGYRSVVVFGSVAVMAGIVIFIASGKKKDSGEDNSENN